MALLDRVATLIKANLNDLVDKAENPEKLLKQLLLDMQNQFMQVKTQVAIAIADQHLLEKKQHESVQAQQEWVHKAELALAKNQEDLARVALERSLTFEIAAKNFAQQLDDQVHQVQTLRDALYRLEQKMAETKARTEVLLAQHRRARTATATVLGDFKQTAAFDRMQTKVTESEALARGHQIVVAETDSEQRLNQLERSDRIDRLLTELKQKHAT
jgi:phage shock protein A